MKGQAPKKAGQPFVIMVKPVGPRCNLECSYCYYLETEGAQQSSSQHCMSREVLETLIRRYIEASPGPVVSFTWHGGEPTLAGLEFYRLAVKLQKRYLPQGWTCWNSLQTNGILLDDEWCAFLAENHFDVGLSIDGTAWLHDAYRKDRGGRGTYDLAVAAARRLQARDLQPDLLCTVTADAAERPLEVYRALRDLRTGWVQFIPIVRRDKEGHLTPDSITGAGYGRFLCAVFDEWVLHDLGELGVQLFAETMLVGSGGNTNLCWMAATCGRALVVEQDGSVYSCDHFVAPGYRLGDIKSSPLSDLVDSPQQRRFGNDKRDRLPPECRSCSWLLYCRGGCPKDRFAAAASGDPGINILCDGLRQFFAHAEKPLRQVNLLSKRGLTPEAIMDRLRRSFRG